MHSQECSRLDRLWIYPFLTSISRVHMLLLQLRIESFLQKNADCKSTTTVIVSVGLDSSFCKRIAEKIRKIDEEGLTWKYVPVEGVRDEPDTYLISYLKNVIWVCEKSAPSRIIFHCMQGQSRSVFLLAALLILSYKGSHKGIDEEYHQAIM